MYFEITFCWFRRLVPRKSFLFVYLQKISPLCPQLEIKDVLVVRNIDHVRLEINWSIKIMTPSLLMVRKEKVICTRTCTRSSGCVREFVSRVYHCLSASGSLCLYVVSISVG